MSEKCRYCGSTELLWSVDVYSTSPAGNGRLRYHELQVRFVLGCDDCGETIRVLDFAEFCEALPERARQQTHEKLSQVYDDADFENFLSGFAAENYSGDIDARLTAQIHRAMRETKTWLHRRTNHDQ